MSDKPELQLVRTDGQTVYTLADEAFEMVSETRKDREGNVTPTGITKRTFVFKTTAKELKEGMGVATALPDGQAAVVKELRVTERYVSADALEAERAANRWNNFRKDFRRFAGLSKSAKPVSEGDKLTLKDVENFCNGFRKVKGYFFVDLPEATQKEVSKAYGELLKKANGQKAKAPTATQLLEAAMIANREGVELGPDWLEAFEQIKKRAAKAKATKVATPKAEVELTEQSDI